MPDEGRERSETLWAFTTLGTGVGLALAGSVRVAFPSQIEHSYASSAAAFGWPSPRPRRAKITPALGGLVVSGHF